MNNISLDFETYSEAPIKTVGAHRYIEDSSFEILCLAYSIDNETPKIWIPPASAPLDLISALNDPSYTIRAYNANFERLVINKCYKQLGLNKPPVIKRYIDTMAIVCSNSYPASLDRAGEAINSKELKDKRGKYLLNKLTKPKKSTRVAPFTRWTPRNNPSEFQELYDYCLQDVRTEQGILNKLPRDDLIGLEPSVWRHTVIQNDRGLYIDTPLVKAILKVLEEYKTIKLKELVALTGGVITTGNQVARIKQWCADRGVMLPNLNAETVLKYQNKDNIPNEVKQILEFRKLLSKSSTAKFTKILQMLCRDNTVKGNLFYYRAITGRYGGVGFQMHNLPRAKAKDPEPLIEAFHNGLEAVKEFGPNVMENASKLIRPCIISPPGKDLIVSDYSAIENRCLHWCAEDDKVLKEFGCGLDQYKTYAADRFNVHYDDVTDYQRFYGKTAILGLGYMMGAKTYVAAAAGYGLELELDQAQEEVNFYREKYYKVKKHWYKLYGAALACVNTGRQTICGKTLFGYFNNKLYMKLPSGRAIVYNLPETSMETMPWGQRKEIISFMGINPYSGKWQRLLISPGRLVENEIQGLARDILVQGAINVEKKGYKVIGTVHDEVLAYVPKGFGSQEEFDSLLCHMPDWAEGLPLKAKGYRGYRYKKD